MVRRDLTYWLFAGDIPMSLDAPASLGDRLLTYEADLHQHIAHMRRTLPGLGYLAMHTTVRWGASTAAWLHFVPVFGRATINKLIHMLCAQCQACRWGQPATRGHWSMSGAMEATLSPANLSKSCIQARAGGSCRCRCFAEDG